MATFSTSDHFNRSRNQQPTMQQRNPNVNNINHTLTNASNNANAAASLSASQPSMPMRRSLMGGSGSSSVASPFFASNVSGGGAASSSSRTGSARITGNAPAATTAAAAHQASPPRGSTVAPSQLPPTSPRPAAAGSGRVAGAPPASSVSSSSAVMSAGPPAAGHVSSSSLGGGGAMAGSGSNSQGYQLNRSVSPASAAAANQSMSLAGSSLLASPRYPQHHYYGNPSDDDEEAPALGMGQLVPPLWQGGATQRRLIPSVESPRFHPGGSRSRGGFGDDDEATGVIDAEEVLLPPSAPHSTNKNSNPVVEMDDADSSPHRSKSRGSTVVVSDASPNSVTHRGGAAYDDDYDTEEEEEEEDPLRRQSPLRRGGSAGGRPRPSTMNPSDHRGDDATAVQTLSKQRIRGLDDRREALARQVARELPDRHAHAARRLELREEELEGLSATARRELSGAAAVDAKEGQLIDDRLEELRALRADNLALAEEEARLVLSIDGVRSAEVNGQQRFHRTIEAIEAEVAAIDRAARTGRRRDAGAKGQWAEEGFGSELPTLMGEIIRVTRQLQRHSEALGAEHDGKQSAIDGVVGTAHDDAMRALEGRREELVSHYLALARRERGGGQGEGGDSDGAVPNGSRLQSDNNNGGNAAATSSGRRRLSSFGVAKKGTANTNAVHRRQPSSSSASSSSSSDEAPADKNRNYQRHQHPLPREGLVRRRSSGGLRAPPAEGFKAVIGEDSRRGGERFFIPNTNANHNASEGGGAATPGGGGDDAVPLNGRYTHRGPRGDGANLRGRQQSPPAAAGRGGAGSSSLFGATPYPVSGGYRRSDDDDDDSDGGDSLGEDGGYRRGKGAMPSFREQKGSHCGPATLGRRSDALLTSSSFPDVSPSPSRSRSPQQQVDAYTVGSSRRPSAAASHSPRGGSQHGGGSAIIPLDKSNISAMPGTRSRRRYIDPMSTSPGRPSWVEDDRPTPSVRSAAATRSVSPSVAAAATMGGGPAPRITSTYRQAFGEPLMPRAVVAVRRQMHQHMNTHANVNGRASVGPSSSAGGAAVSRSGSIGSAAGTAHRTRSGGSAAHAWNGGFVSDRVSVRSACGDVRPFVKVPPPYVPLSTGEDGRAESGPRGAHRRRGAEEGDEGAATSTYRRAYSQPRAAAAAGEEEENEGEVYACYKGEGRSHSNRRRYRAIDLADGRRVGDMMYNQRDDADDDGRTPFDADAAMARYRRACDPATREALDTFHSESPAAKRPSRGWVV